MQTLEIIRTLAQESPELDTQTKKKILEALDGKKKWPVLHDTKTAAAMLGIHPATLREYAAHGLIRAVRFTARKFWWDQEELERFMREGPRHEN